MADEVAPQLGNWEEGAQALPDIANLQISDKPATTIAAEVSGPESLISSNGIEAGASAPSVDPTKEPAAPPTENPVCDPAIVEALKDPKERLNVVHLEELVEKFINDSSKEVLEFPGNFTNYQRMLAHRVAQYYGLQTSTVDYEEGPGRVIGHRTKFTGIPQLKPSAFEVKPAEGRSSHERGPRILRRPSGSESRGPGGSGGDGSGSNQTRSLEEREEDYHKARERIIGQNNDSARALSGRANGGPARSVGSGGGRGRGELSGSGGSRDFEGGRGRGRKAVFRDRDRELNDPDYRRGVNRYGSSGFDPNAPVQPGGVYVPTYQSEFPTLARTASGSSAGAHHSMAGAYRADYNSSAGWAPSSPSFRPPPPPPPPGAAGPPGAKAGTITGYPQQPGSPGPVSAVPPQAMQVPRPYASMHPGMSPAMAPYPMPMAFHPGMAHPGIAGMQQQAMYSQYPAFYAGGMPPGSYGFMHPDGTMASPYHMPYAMSPMGAYPGAAPIYMQGMPSTAGQMHLGRTYSGSMPPHNGMYTVSPAQEYGHMSSEKTGQHHTRAASANYNGLANAGSRGSIEAPAAAGGDK